MSLIVPSYFEKLSWSEQHLVKLESLIDTFAASDPYEVREVMEDDEQAWVLVFTASPDRTTALIAGDFLYNVRGALDHLACALVPPEHRGGVAFPIVYEPVWDIPRVKGEPSERTQARNRWNRVTCDMSEPAVTRLKAAQPTNLAGRAPEMHVLDVLRRLRNKDAHENLAVVLTALGDLQYVRWTRPDGTIGTAQQGNVGPGQALENGAVFRLPPPIVKVEAKGTPRVAIRVAENPREIVEIPVTFRKMLNTLRVIVNDLAPHVHGLTST
jgi:hypothetical protein